ncbi:hypothetical protein RC62_4394 [Flavobacterium aquidurense]|uniref:Uncharacterized protein n=1 Tax=Flavobacterium aquidurense TaxID=362413 RepID=A0A0Q0W327_9FLAO|nr:hypothetical protein RC62_4394 [Flavobacterium aquidurense]
MTFNEKYKNNALLIKTFNFALNIIDYTSELQEQKKFVIANQLLKKRNINWSKLKRITKRRK